MVIWGGLTFLTILGQLSAYSEELNSKKFPDDFMFGVSTSAFQTEGAWNENGKGENIWDHYTHKNPNNILDGSNADNACNSYHKIKEDIKIIKNLGVNFYRFSLSWSRILPKGFEYKINNDGIRYYNNLINMLLKNNIVPMVTIFNWDTPQPIEELGGFASSLIVDWFEAYSKIAYENFGDRVKHWITFNDPAQMCQSGYGEGTKAPGYTLSGIADYMCAHNVLKSHARTYHLYNNTYKLIQKGRISIAIDGTWYEPATKSRPDRESSNRAMDFKFGWFADPIFHRHGNYPLSMKELIAKNSESEQFPYSRLPEFTISEINYVKGTYDYFALNHFGSILVTEHDYDPSDGPSYANDIATKLLFHAEWNQSESTGLQILPRGLRKVLNWIKNRYGDIEIMITENGYSDQGDIGDNTRIQFLKHYLSALLDAIYKDKVKVTAYAVRSLLDSFEWNEGYLYKYGLYHVNFSHPNRTRTPKASAKFYKELIETKMLANNGKNLSISTFFMIIPLLFFYFGI